MTSTVEAIDTNEMETVLGILSPKSPSAEVRKRVSEAKKDSFGMIEYDEFRHWVSQTDVSMIFKLIDINADGVLDATEVETIFKVLDPAWTSDKVKTVLEQADTNGDGKIDYQEFLQWTYKQASEVNAKENTCPVPLDAGYTKAVSPDPQSQDQFDLLQWAESRNVSEEDGRNSPVRTSSRQQLDKELNDTSELAQRLCKIDPTMTLEAAQKLIENAQRSLVVFPGM